MAAAIGTTASVTDAAALLVLQVAIAQAIVTHLTTAGEVTGDVVITGGSSAGTYPITNGKIV